MSFSFLEEKFAQPTSSFKLSNFNACNGDTTASVTSGIVFIDSTVDDYEMLMAGDTGLRSGAAG